MILFMSKRHLNCCLKCQVIKHCALFGRLALKTTVFLVWGFPRIVEGKILSILSVREKMDAF
jgi:hypothetical protein